ncbi:response regulator transcription factor [Paenibacillus woosongensis]|uniref:Response regulator n=1 Tax=Paenibacillus woosongensis TaxID=307580 RepID=A0A7X2YZP2_9BACL|nr:response regulator [Paenibacillus woosongensis]MUG44074.1 response regulator [Paenibacillus woosongensis]
MTCRLLIADDEHMISESLSTMDEWAERDVDVVGTAANGREVMDWLERTHIDLLITDIQMPDMNGLELMEHLHKHRPDIHMIVISGYEEFDYVKKAMKYRAAGYVLKPIDTDELLAIVDDILATETPRQASTEEADPELVPMTYHENVVERAITFMHDHLDNDISLKDAAEQFHLTTQYFGQVFKSVTGQTFLSFLTQIRMEKACELLRNPELTQYAVGEMVGYKDSRYFSKVFHKTYGMTPRDYRRQLMKKKRCDL